MPRRQPSQHSGRARNLRRHRQTIFETLEPRTLMSVSPLYYSVDGTGNNAKHPLWGSVGTNLLRISGIGYGDGKSSMAGATRPGARAISNTISVQPFEFEENSRSMTDMIYAWGQFIDHDLDLTPSGTESQPIAIPSDDSIFDPNGSMSFFRAVWDSATGTSTSNPRQQTNVVTSFLDGSMIYGSDAARASALRTHSGGLLKSDANNLLPINSGNLPENVDFPGVNRTDLFLTGDVRGNENIELTSLQVLFVREHNFWANKLHALHPRWSDEQLYQSARQIVIAEIQSITVNEFVPALLGNALGPYHGYNANVNPGIATEFSEAGFRVGHTLLNEGVDFFFNDGNESHDPVDFTNAGDNPSMLLQSGTGVDNILKYLATDNAQEVDLQIEDGFRNFLFDPTNHAGLDLNAIDIQRARDVGIPDYNTVRASVGLPKVTSFSQITSDTTIQNQLQALYGNVDNIDLLVGALAEDHAAGASVGPTLQRIIAQQFDRLRTGDSRWYQKIFSGADLQAIQNTTLADIMQRNTNITNLQQDVFFFKAGTIGGTVTIANGNNRFTMAGVTVQLFNSSNQLVATTKTAADGSYSFDTGDSGATYSVRVAPPSTYGLFQNPAPHSATLAFGSGAGTFDADLDAPLFKNLFISKLGASALKQYIAKALAAG